MKTCFKCGSSKELSEFYKHPQMADGHLGKCKDCTKSDVIRNRDAKLEYYQSYDRDRYKLPHVAARIRATAEAWGAKHPERRKTHIIVHNALRDGKLRRGSCEVCGSNRVHAHHDDYTKPLDVRWLCPSHHRRHHMKLEKP